MKKFVVEMTVIRPVRGSKAGVINNVVCEFADGLVQMPGGIAFPLSNVAEIIFGDLPAVKAPDAARPENKPQTPKKAEGGGSPKSGPSKPPEPKPAVRTTKKVRRKQG